MLGQFIGKEPLHCVFMEEMNIFSTSITLISIELNGQ